MKLILREFKKYKLNMSWKITNKLNNNSEWTLHLTIYDYLGSDSCRNITIPTRELQENDIYANKLIKQISTYNFPYLISALNEYRYPDTDEI